MEILILTQQLPPEFKGLPAILNTKTIAELLDVHPNTVTGLLDRGKLKGFKVGRVWRVHRRDFLRYIGLENGEDDDSSQFATH